MPDHLHVLNRTPVPPTVVLSALLALAALSLVACAAGGPGSPPGAAREPAPSAGIRATPGSHASASSSGAPGSSAHVTASASSGSSADVTASASVVATSSGGAAVTAIGLSVTHDGRDPAREVSVSTGTTVRITVTSDRDDELVVAAYDARAPLPAGHPGTVELVADKAGTFAVTMTTAGRTVVRLHVT